MTLNRETTEHDDTELLAHPIDPMIVAAYRSMMPNWTMESTWPEGRVNSQDTVPAPSVAGDVDPELERLKERYQALISCGNEALISGYRLRQRLGQGGQGIVYLAQCAGADDFQNDHLALKLFSPHRYPTVDSYEKDMRRIARVASIVAGIDQGNVLDVHRFEDCDGIRMMVMKRVKGYDLRQLMNPGMLECVSRRDQSLWNEITDIVAVPAIPQTNFRPGAAVAVIRSCLEALDKLHSRGIVHGDVKPSNIMISPEGEVKLVDTGSAFECRESRRPYFCTPRYAALEVLEEGVCTPRSDLASLGYVLLELLTGSPVFPGNRPQTPRETSMPQEASTGIRPTMDHDLAEEKRQLPGLVDQLLTTNSSHLKKLCRRLIEPDPMRRFTSALEAELYAYAYVQELERAGLGCHFPNEFRRWLDALQTAPRAASTGGPPAGAM